MFYQGWKGRLWLCQVHMTFSFFYIYKLFLASFFRHTFPSCHRRLRGHLKDALNVKCQFLSPLHRRISHLLLLRLPLSFLCDLFSIFTPLMCQTPSCGFSPWSFTFLCFSPQRAHLSLPSKHSSRRCDEPVCSFVQMSAILNTNRMLFLSVCVCVCVC